MRCATKTLKYSEPGCVYFGWTKVGDKVQTREAYKDGAAVRAHMENVRPILDRLLSGPAKLNQVELKGPAAELAKAKSATAELDARANKLESSNK